MNGRCFSGSCGTRRLPGARGTWHMHASVRCVALLLPVVWGHDYFPIAEEKHTLAQDTVYNQSSNIIGTFSVCGTMLCYNSHKGISLYFLLTKSIYDCKRLGVETPTFRGYLQSALPANRNSSPPALERSRYSILVVNTTSRVSRIPIIITVSMNADVA